MLGQSHDKGGQQQSLDVRVLVRHVKYVLLRGPAVRADHRTRLHGVGDQAVIGQVQFGHMGGARKSRVHLGLVANRPFVAMIVGGRVMQGRGLGRIGDTHHGAQYVVVHLDQLGGVFGLLQRLGHHHGYVVTHITHLALRQDGVRRLFHRIAVGAGDQPATRQAVDLVGRHIFTDKHIQYTRRGFGGCDFDAVDVGVRMR